MQYNLNRVVRFAWEQEYKSLYQWSLQEFGQDGKAKGGKCVPWEWTLNFIGKELRHTLKAESRPNAEGIGESKVTETIRMTLTPDGTWREVAPSYSFFGTDRSLKTFSMSVFCLTNDTEPERCHTWGSVSYTTEDEYGRETTEDCMEVYLWLRPSSFVAVRHAALQGNGEFTIELGLKGVAGFYSQWSPVVTADAIKVLGSQKDQAVEAPADLGPLPALGQVGEFSFTVTRKSQLAPARPPINADDEEEEKLSEPAVHAKEDPSLAAALATESAKIQYGLMLLRLPVWLLFIAVAVMLFK